MEESSHETASRVASLLARRQELTQALADSPYDLILYLRRALVHSDLGYPDLAAGDAYRALLLTDEVRDGSFEYHEQAVEALRNRAKDPPPDILDYGALSTGSGDLADGYSAQGPELHQEITALASVRCFQVLSLSLLLCGCLRSAYDFCDRGLVAAPSNRELLNIKEYIGTVARRRLRTDHFVVADLPDRGLVPREVYPWNTHEPDRVSPDSLARLNKELAAVAPKCEVRVAQLPVLLEGASDTDDYDIIPTCEQLGLFARVDIAPGEVVLDEYSVLTANSRRDEPACDACGSALPPLGPDSTAAACPDCDDAVFCDATCLARAQALYHPAVCDKDVDTAAKDPKDAHEATEALYLLLLVRVLAMAAHQDAHPLDVREVRSIWGDFLPSAANHIDLSANAGPPPEWTLPFSFRHNIEQPLSVLERMGADIYATLARHDIWVLNTLYAKFRGTASARKSRRDGRPDVAAVHPLWCLANHDCDPNVTWEWGGRMRLWARETRVAGGRPGGIRAGEEILNHYCDVDLPVKQRREWAQGSLGGWCMCQRCRDEAGQSQNGTADGG